MEILRKVLLATAIFDIVFAVVVYIRARSKTRELASAYVSLFVVVGIWELFMWLSFFINAGIEVNMLIDQLTGTFGALAVFGFLYFMWIVGERKGLSFNTIAGLFSICVVIIMLSFIPDVVVQGRIYYSDIPYDYYLIPGPLMLGIYCYIFTLFGILVYHFIVVRKRIDFPVRKAQFNYIGWSIIIALMLNMIGSVLVPVSIKFVFNRPQLSGSNMFITQQAVGVISISIISAIVAFVITRYRFLGIKIQIKQQLAYTILITILIGGLGAVTALLMQYIGTWGLLISFALSIMYFLLFDRKVRFWMDSLFFLKVMDPSKRFTWDNRTLDSSREIMFWLDRVKEICHDRNFQFIAMYTLQHEHNRLTNPEKPNKHLWNESEFVAHLKEHYITIMPVDKLAVSVPRVAAEANYVLVFYSEGEAYGILFIQATNEKEVHDFYNYIGPNLISVVNYYAVAESAKITVKEDIYDSI